MSRRKKEDQEQTETNTSLETLDAEQEEADELEDEPSEVLVSVSQKKSNRKTAKAALASPLMSMAKAESMETQLSPEESSDSQEMEEDSPSEEMAVEPAKGRGRGSRLDVVMKKNVAQASATSKKAIESIEKQWRSVEEISQSTSANLERIHGLMKEIPATFATSMQDLLKPPAAKTSPLNRVAFGASAIAIVFSLLSLSLSQSARQAALSSQITALNQGPRIEARSEKPTGTDPIRSSPTAQAAPEIAMRRETKRRSSIPAPLRNAKGAYRIRR